MIISLIGYYGFKNIGDDLMLSNLISFFLAKKKIKRIFVFVRDNYYQINNEKVKIIPLSKLSRLKKTFAILRSNFVIWGGGTCLYEGSNNRGLYDLYKVQKITNMFGKKFIFFGIGVGFLENREIIHISKKILDHSRFIYFRDVNSSKRAQQITNVDNSCVGGDLAFLSDISINNPKNKCNSIKRISFSGVFDQSDITAKFYAQELNKISEHFNAEIHFLPSHLGEKNDNEFHKRIIENNLKASFTMHLWNSVDEYVKILQRMDFHIGMRLHSIVLADLVGIPNIGIVYSPKVKYYIQKSTSEPEKRIFDLREKIELGNIEFVYRNYEYQSEFIQTERESVITCLDKFWNIYG